MSTVDILVMKILHTTAESRNGKRGIDLDFLMAQQARLRHYARLHWVYWVILSLSLIVTVFIWKSSESILQLSSQSRFEHEAKRTINQIHRRLGNYEDALLSSVAAMQSQGGDMSRQDWKRYSELLNLEQRYPGIKGIGVIDYVALPDIPAFLEQVRSPVPDYNVFPAHPYELSLPIKYIEPEDKNQPALGLDIAFETNRRIAALNARQTGSTRISGPITLAQDSGNTPGFLFYAPFYDDTQLQQSQVPDEDARKQSFRGLIYVPLLVRDLIEGTLLEANPMVSMSIYDAGELLFKDETPARSEPAAFTLKQQVNTHGRLWIYTLSSTPVFENTVESSQPTLVLICGLSLDAMLYVLFWVMSRSNHAVLTLAEEMTTGLSDQAQQLSENNLDLESFAHIVSHDLKTPLRNIHSIAQILEEDLDSYLASNDPKAEIQPCLNKLQDQVTRSQSLISGILEYSTQDDTKCQTTKVDTLELVTSIGRQLDLPPEKLSLIGNFPSMETNQTRLEQVFTNLIQNAIKYNPCKDTATVQVSAETKKDFYQFSVTDNGPGIEPRFHEKIFQPFTTLEPVTDIHSSGIGLSIVQRAIERQGGYIEVSSQTSSEQKCNTGTTFAFTWPIQDVQPESVQGRRYG